MKRAAILFGAAAMFACLPAAAWGQQWNDNFDSYGDGETLYHVGGWTGWDDNQNAAGVTSSAFSRSAPNSIEIAGDTDAIHGFTGVDSGQWTFSAWMYIPSDLSSLTSFIVQNEYQHGGPYQWAIEIHFDPDTDLVWDYFRDPNMQSALPVVYDRWAEIRLEMDLDNDYVEQYYDGQLLMAGTYAIRGGAVEFANLDLYAFLVASPVYYDDLTLVPEPEGVLLLVLAGGVLLRRR